MQAERVDYSELVRRQRARRERTARRSRWVVLGELAATCVGVLLVAVVIMAMAIIAVGMVKAGAA